MMRKDILFWNRLSISNRLSSAGLAAVVGCSLLAAAGLRAQESTASFNFGSVAVGSSSTEILTLTIPSSATLGGIAELTQGAPYLDFAKSDGGTCKEGTAYAAGATCMVGVRFAPRAAGTRYGAVVLTDSASNVIATDLLEGVGTGPQAMFLPRRESKVAASGLNQPANLVVDGSGSLYFVDAGNGRVVKETNSAGGYTESTAFSGLSDIGGLAVDGGGNLYIAVANDILKESWNGSSFVQSTVGSGLSSPNGISVDSGGNIYIADVYNGRVVKETLATGAYTQSVILTCGTAGEQSCPSSVAVDGSGDVFVAAYNSSQITKLTPSLGGYTQSTIDASLNGPSSIVVDGLGNLYVADTLNSRAVELALTANGYVQSTVTSSALDQPLGVAVDQLGNVYIADTEHQRVLKEDISGTPELSFALTYFGATSSDSPKTEQVLNYGNEVLAITGLSFPPDFPEANDDANACTTSTSLSANQECDLPIDFTPGAEYGLPDTVQLSEDVTITDNALNVSGAQQSVAVNGSWWWDEGCGCAFYLTVAAPSNVVAGVPFDITVTAYFIGVVLDYNGFITYSSTDPSSVLPPEYQGLTNGVGTFKVTLQTPGIQTITATDEDSITGTSGSINVTAATHVAASEGSMNFGSRVIGSASGAETLNFSISAGTTVGSVAVLTQGAPNMDFTQATGSTCTAAVYASTTSCTVNVIFTPKAAGLRLGAVVFFSEGGNTGMQLASLPVSGSGTGAQVAYGPSTATAIDPVVNGASLSDPLGVAVDGLGDLFIADSYPNPRVVKVPAGGGAATAISPALDGMGLLSSWGLAVDGAGDLFIASTWWAGDGYAQEWGVQVIEAPAGGGLAKAIRPGLYLPTDIAVNGAGDLFIADSGNSRVVKVQAGGGAATTIAPTVNGLGLNTPYGVAVDGAGDLFVVDTGNNRVVEIPAGGEGAIAIAPTVGGIAFNAPEGIAVDAAGDLFIADTNNNRVVEVPAGGGAAIAIAPVVNGLGLNGPAGIAVDGTGNLFITDSNNNRVVRIQRSQPPAVNFPTVTSVGSIDTKDGTQTVQIFNIGNVALDLTALSYPADFSKAGGDANACTGSTSLSPGAECDVPIEFTPENFGSPLSEDVTLTDNALSGAGAKQSIAVTGQSQPAAAALSLPNPGSVLAGPEVTFSWAPVTGATGYTLKLGTALGSTNLWNAGEQKATSQEIGNLPTNGETIYARLYTFFGSVVMYSDSIYTAATAAGLTTPVPGTVLAGASVTFAWSAAPGATGYSLALGTGKGLSNVYNSGKITGTSTTASKLPTNGETIYARLYTIYGDVTAYSDYLYTAQ